MIVIHDKSFELFITRQQIQEAVNRVADLIARDFEGQVPLLIPMLNGAFIFAADLMRALPMDCEVAFIKAKSYEGTSSSGKVIFDLPLKSGELLNRPIIIVEDIVDTGHTIAQVLPQLVQYHPTTIKVACLLHKPDALLHPDLPIDYVGMNIENKFVVGYGLDYDGLGRNYPDIYQLAI